MQVPIQMQPGATRREPQSGRGERGGVPIGIRIVTERRRPKQTKLKAAPTVKSAAQAEQSSERERERRRLRERESPLVKATNGATADKQ